MQVDYVNKATL